MHLTKTSPIRFMTVILLAAAMFSCQRIEYEYHDEYTSDKEEDVYRIVQNDLLSASFRLVELTEVFSGYQEIRSDREKALKYVKGFFDTSNYVYYEYMHIHDWGKIYLVEEGIYKATPEYWRSFWIALNTPRQVRIETTAPHCYSFASTEESAVWDIKAEVQDLTVRISELTVSIASDTFGTAAIETIEPMEMPMCSNGKGKLEPTCGRIRIRYRSSYADKVFEVEFHEDGKTFILPDGTTREVEPQKAYGRNEY